jgi:hypothetical protein
MGILGSIGAGLDFVGANLTGQGVTGVPKGTYSGGSGGFSGGGGGRATHITLPNGETWSLEPTLHEPDPGRQAEPSRRVEPQT